ncbi:MAG: hypothetical protein JXA09_00785, partial [Anaerolineae bacterium]|nr:hypothetical protein [Anaerolineae bacterium]
RPIVVRNLRGGDTGAYLRGRTFTAVRRRGKFLLLSLDDGGTVVIQPMLAGRVRYGPPLTRHRKRDVLVLSLSNDLELRYYDPKDMGKVYVTDTLEQVPTYADLGPEATDPELTLEAFHTRLRRERGEIKSVLTRQSFVAGIGNAYADEICWRARLYPFRRRSSLDQAEIERLYRAMRDVLSEATAAIRAQIDDQTDVEIRSFLSVHGRAGEACPRCGGTISEVKRERRATHFCRACQPGLMLDTLRRQPRAKR